MLAFIKTNMKAKSNFFIVLEGNERVSYKYNESLKFGNWFVRKDSKSVQFIFERQQEKLFEEIMEMLLLMGYLKEEIFINF